MSASIASGTYPRAGTLTFGRPSSRSFGSRVWHFLAEIGRSRAAPQLRMLASEYENSDPELAARLRRAADPATYRH
jgi:hypothetical protein